MGLLGGCGGLFSDLAYLTGNGYRHSHHRPYNDEDFRDEGLRDDGRIRSSQMSWQGATKRLHLKPRSLRSKKQLADKQTKEDHWSDF